MENCKSYVLVLKINYPYFLSPRQIQEQVQKRYKNEIKIYNKINNTHKG